MESEITSMVAAFAALILLAATAMRYGVDSREAFVSKERELAARGFVWDGLSPAHERREPSPRRAARLPAQASDRGIAPCRA
jgi:hypothetical protein